MPSRWESFGLVAVEAQMNGLPVLANNTSSLPEVVLENKTGILLDFTNIPNVTDFISAHDTSFGEICSMTALNLPMKDLKKKRWFVSILIYINKWC